MFRVSVYWAEADNAEGGIYAQRSSTCRSVQPGDPQCLRARAHHGLG